VLPPRPPFSLNATANEFEVPDEDATLNVVERSYGRVSLGSIKKVAG
jgi:hypothetical protein